ncbi:MAG TPA: SDR family oxidoreductase [Trebonia sp.]|nr:SDR family oxidoreductase [Trebonia sp.]
MPCWTWTWTACSSAHGKRSRSELGLQYASQGIQVNALCPGFYQTNLSRGAIDDPQVRAAITAFIPVGRIAAAAETKGPALFLASATSDYMTGQTLVTDGGCLAK